MEIFGLQINKVILIIYLFIAYFIYHLALLSINSNRILNFKKSLKLKLVYIFDDIIKIEFDIKKHISYENILNEFKFDEKSQNYIELYSLFSDYSGIALIPALADILLLIKNTKKLINTWDKTIIEKHIYKLELSSINTKEILKKLEIVNNKIMNLKKELPEYINDYNRLVTIANSSQNKMPKILIKKILGLTDFEVIKDTV